MKIRNVQPADYPLLISVLNDWWGGRKMSDMLPKLFFVHFSETSFILEQDNQLCGFIIGFLSQTFANEAYIHFVGIHPDYRKQGLGEKLYTHFFAVVQQKSRNVVRCVTAPTNKSSIAFHRYMGFELEAHETQLDGVPFYPNYDGQGEDRVVFTKYLL